MTTKRKIRHVTVGPDVDFEKEVVILDSGTRLTQQVVDDFAEAAHKLVGGRPSLTGKPERSPQIAFRITPATRAKAEELARQRHTTVSALAREALEEKLSASS